MNNGNSHEYNQGGAPVAEEMQQKVRQATDAVQACMNQTKEYVSDKPMASLMLGLGIGVGAGFVISSLLSSQRPQRQSFTNQAYTTAEGFGQSIYESVMKAVPDAIAKHL